MKLFEIKRLSQINEVFSEKITGDQAVKFMKEFCTDALKNFEKPYVRGMDDMGRWVKLHGAAGERKSSNTTNYYTTILNTALSGEFPKRSKSIICATNDNRYYARDFGPKLYAVFPKNSSADGGMKIGRTEAHDLWRTHITLGGVDKPIVRWNGMFEDAGLPENDFDGLIRGLEEMKSREPKTELEHIVHDMGDIRVEITKEYASHFEAIDTADLDSYKGVHEVWIGQECILIDFEYFMEMWYELNDEINGEE